MEPAAPADPAWDSAARRRLRLRPLVLGAHHLTREGGTMGTRPCSAADTPACAAIVSALSAPLASVARPGCCTPPGALVAPLPAAAAGSLGALGSGAEK